MSFATDFGMEFSCFRIDPELDKYLSNVSDPILLMWYNEALRLEIKNENEKDIENSVPRSFLSKEGLQHSPYIFDKHNFRL